jgi:hypothetical protein
MKIYNPEPTPLVRLQIRKAKEETFYLTLHETTRKEVVDFVRTVIKDKINPFPEGIRTSIHIRDAIGAKNLKSETLSFYGLEPKEVYNLILKELKK